MIDIDDLYFDDDLMDAFRCFVGLTKESQLLPDNWHSHFRTFRKFHHQHDASTPAKVREVLAGMGLSDGLTL